MNELCTNHPEREALSVCHSCKRYFCRECLIERGGYHYCFAEECRKSAPVDPLPEMFHCPFCNEYLRLSDAEQISRQFVCPSCHKHCSVDEESLTKLTVGGAPRREYANVLTRLGAIVIDSLLVAVFYIPFILLVESTPSETSGEAVTTILFVILFVGMMVFGIWNGIVRMGKTGQSLGRKFLNIAVLDERGRPIGVGKAFLREVIGRWVSGIVCYLGYLNAFWDKKKQMWHDKMANCYVYYVEDDFS